MQHDRLNVLCDARTNASREPQRQGRGLARPQPRFDQTRRDVEQADRGAGCTSERRSIGLDESWTAPRAQATVGCAERAAVVAVAGANGEGIDGVGGRLDPAQIGPMGAVISCSDGHEEITQGQKVVQSNCPLVGIVIDDRHPRP